MPKSKKNESESSDSDSGPDDKAPPSKKSKDSSSQKKSNKEDEDTNKWVLDKQRQVRVNEFRGRKLIDIREYYEKNGESLPGRKGISLSITQWKKLLEIAEEVNRAVGE